MGTEGNRKRKRSMDDDEETTEGAAVVAETLVVCTLCSTPLSSTWYLPPSRHGCTVSTTSSGQKVTSASARRRSRVRARRLSRQPVSEVADKSVLNTRENNSTEIVVPVKPRCQDVVQSESTPLHECPLGNCARECRSKADLQVHLAMSHYKEELEKDYITIVEKQDAKFVTRFCQVINK